MGGCGTKHTAVLEAQTLTDAKTADAPLAPVLTEASAEEKALTQLKIIFDGIDKNEDCSVSKEELAAALDKDESLGALIKEAGFDQNYKVLEQLDTNKDGRVTWDEFHANLKRAATEEVHATGQVAAVELPADEKALKQLKKLFELLDANADAAVSKEELAAGLSKDESVGKLVEEAGFNPHFCVLEQLDTNHDGRIAWEEFEAHLRSAAKEEVKEQGAVTATVVLDEQQKEVGADEASEEVAGAVVAPRSVWCC